MCNVCVADTVISAGEKGYRLTYGKHPAVLIRTRATEAERGRAEYQIKREGEEWPARWTRSGLVLADVMGTYGFDVVWDAMPKIVRQWIEGSRAKPNVRQIDQSRSKEE